MELNDRIPHRCRGCKEHNPWFGRTLWALLVIILAVAVGSFVMHLGFWVFLGYAPYLFCLWQMMRWFKIHHPARKGVTWAPPGSWAEQQMLSRINWWERPLND